jgi:predicted RNase H-like nuclease
MAKAAALGIDAAWTEKNASGVALLTFDQKSIECISMAPGYSAFLEPMKSPSDLMLGVGGLPDAHALVERCKQLSPSSKLMTVAVDMPLARGPIRGRRRSDNEVSSAFGKYKCGTHSPSAERPGKIACRLRDDFAREGFALATDRPKAKSLIEVYPHPALVNFFGLKERSKYKTSRKNNYWPNATPEQRRRNILKEWVKIVHGLSLTIKGLDPLVKALSLLPGKPESCYKSVEDTIDAIICAYVGVCYARGEAIGYGDGDSAIWVPQAQFQRQSR